MAAPLFDPAEALRSMSTECAVEAIRNASRQLLLPVDIDLYFRALLEVESDSASIVSKLDAYLSERKA